MVPVGDSGVRRRQEFHHLAIAQLVEVAIVETDRMKGLRTLEADDVIDQWAELSKRVGR